MRAPVPAGYTMRPADPADISAIAAVGRACDLADFGEVDISEDWLRDEWRRPRFDPTTDAWVVTAADGEVVAAASSWDEGASTIFDSAGSVHPGHRGRGVGAALARAVEVRAARDAAALPAGSAPRVHQVFDAANAGAHALFEGLGYAPVRGFQHMQIEVGPGRLPGPEPHGIRIRPRADADDPAIHAAAEEAFRNHWGFRPEPYEEWLDEWRSSGSYDPTLWLVATAGDEIVGAMLANLTEGRGWIGDLAVRDAWRRRGIGEALLRAAFALFAERGVTTVMLNVDRDNTTGATRLYERAGMHVRRRWLVVAKTLTAAP